MKNTISNLQEKAGEMMGSTFDGVKDSLKRPENSGKIKKKVDAVYQWFIKPLAGAKEPKTINFYNLPPVVVELVSWYRPKVTGLIALMSFYMYFLIATEEYTLLGLASSVLYFGLLFAVIAHQILPFLGYESKVNIDILPKAKIDKWTKEIVVGVEKQVEAAVYLIECEDYGKTFSSLVALYLCSVISNQITDMFVLFLILAFVFTAPYFMINNQKKLEYLFLSFFFYTAFIFINNNKKKKKRKREITNLID